MTQEPDFGAALKAGLAQIAGQIIDSCTFSVPETPDGETIDQNRTNVIVTRGDGTIALILPDNSGACDEGWRFTDDGNVELCEASCNDVKVDAKASLSLTFGCATDEIIPR
jgi:hypothetical protein